VPIWLLFCRVYLAPKHRFFFDSVNKFITKKLHSFLNIKALLRGTRVRSLFRHCATRRKDCDLTPVGVIGILH
jgi:hypothetical protein